MGRTSATLLIAGLIGFGLVGCASPDVEPSASDTPPAPSASATASEAPADGETAEELCATASDSDDAQVCVLENVTASADLSFTSYRIVKLIGGSFAGAVDISGAQQVTITDAEFASDLTVDATGGAVVKLSTVGGTLSVEGGRNATLVKNTVEGDLLCADGVQANGDGNAVAGTVTGTCSRVL